MPACSESRICIFENFSLMVLSGDKILCLNSVSLLAIEASFSSSELIACNAGSLGGSSLLICSCSEDVAWLSALS